MSFLRTLPSKSGYSDFSVFKQGKLSQNARVEWISNAIWKIFGYSADKFMNGNPSVTKFFEELENYNFVEFFQNETNPDYYDAVEPSNITPNEDDQLDMQQLLLRLERFHDILMKYSEKPNSNNDNRRKRQTDIETACSTIDYYAHPYEFTYFYDGPYLSLGKTGHHKSAKIEDEDLNKLEEYVDTVSEFCPDSYLSPSALKLKLEELKKSIDLKKYDDGMSDRTENPSICEDPKVNTTNKCLCECHKEDKVAIYDIYTGIKMMQETVNVERFGDIYTYYYQNVVQQDPLQIDYEYGAKVDPEIGEEINAFEREVLSDISGIDVDIGLTEYISLMSQPAWVWKENYDFPRMYSLSEETREELQTLFNYDKTLRFSEKLKLKMPNFEKFSLPTACRGNQNFSNYCKLLEKLPDLQTTMHFMNLAKFPLNFQENSVVNLIRYADKLIHIDLYIYVNIKKYFRSFDKSEKSSPKLSYIPTCYYGNEAKKFWETRDYSNDDVLRNTSKKQYEQELNFGNSDFYKYSKCDDFQPNPTDMGICLTFNGLEVNDILKKSNWVDSFKTAFKISENKKIKKSEGIERENGFIFSLGIFSKTIKFYERFDILF